MENNMYPRDSAVIYKTSVDTVLKMKGSPELQGRLATAILQYACYGKYDEAGKDGVLDALMTPIMFSSDNTAQRYDAAVENGKKGGVKSRVDAKAIYEFVRVQKNTQVKAAEVFGYSQKQISRKIKEYEDSLKSNAIVEEPTIDPTEPISIKDWKF